MKLLLILSLTTLLLLTACGQEKIVGNDKDEHGCIGSAGYTWCEHTNKCQRIWEEPCEKSNPEEQEAINKAIDHLKNMQEYKESNGKNIELIEAIPKYCDGFWKINLEFDSKLGKRQANITINSWRVVNAK